MNQELKPIIKKIGQFIYALAFLNTIIIAGYYIVSLVYKHVAPELNIALLGLLNGLCSFMFFWLNKKYNLKL